MHAFPAMLYAKDNGFLVVLADFSEIKATGKTAHDATRNAAMALTRHLESLVAKGQRMPLPGSLDDMLGKSPPNLLARLLIPVDFIGQVVRLNISMDESVLAMADRQSTQLGMTRSGYIAHLIRADRDKMMRATPAAPAAKSKLQAKTVFKRKKR
jgi:predicted RNase H-like HicB family nuclease